MAPNQLTMVRNQLKTRGYAVGEIHLSAGGLDTFDIESEPETNDSRFIGVPVAYIPNTSNLGLGSWVASEIHWWTDKGEYSGASESGPADLADRIVATVRSNNT